LRDGNRSGQKNCEKCKETRSLAQNGSCHKVVRVIDVLTNK
jgi:hypothetical protein